MRDLGPDYTQILEIIGTDKFEEFVKQIEKTEGVGAGVTQKPPSIGVFITPIKTKKNVLILKFRYCLHPSLVKWKA